MKRSTLYAIAVAALTFVVFAIAGTYGLAFCDDECYVTNNIYTNGLTLDGLLCALTDVGEAIWMPFTCLTYMLDFSSGWGYGGMHIQSILWHAVNSALFYALLSRLFKSRSAAIIGALFWAIHPLRVESVIWIASRKDVTSAFFLLASLHAWLNYDQRNWKYIAISFALFLLGAMAKPSIMVYPVFIIALDFLVVNKRKPCWVYATAILLSIGLALFAGHLQSLGGASELSDSIPLWFRLLNAFASITVYLGNTIWPDALAPQCMIRYPDFPRFSPVGSLALGLIVFWVSSVAYPRLIDSCRSRNLQRLIDGSTFDNVILGSFAIFFGSLVPFLGVAGFGCHAFADRFTILPSIGLSLALSYLLSQKELRYALIVPYAAIAALAIQAHRQTLYWGDNEKLMLHTLDVDRDKNTEMHRALGIFYWQDEHDMDKVYQHFKKAFDYEWSVPRRERLIATAHYFIEACYETGHETEADDYYFEFRRVVHKKFGGGAKTLQFMMAELLWTLHSKKPDAIKEAESILSCAERLLPNCYITPNMELHIAKTQGDQKRIIKALKRFSDVKWQVDFCPHRWPDRLLGEFSKHTKE